LNHAESAFF